MSKRYDASDLVSFSLSIGSRFGKDNQYTARMVLDTPPIINVSEGGNVVKTFNSMDAFKNFYFKSGFGNPEPEEEIVW